MCLVARASSLRIEVLRLVEYCRKGNAVLRTLQGVEAEDEELEAALMANFQRVPWSRFLVVLIVQKYGN